MKKIPQKSSWRMLMLFSLLIIVLNESCRKAVMQNPEEKNVADLNSKTINSYAKFSALERNAFKSEFARILAKAVANEPELRAFIQQKALLKFDLDYDILYQTIKNQVVSGGETFHQKLARYSGNAEKLDLIEKNQPLLTIFIPQLPSGFSAETWNPSSEIPSIVIAASVEKKSYVLQG